MFKKLGGVLTIVLALICYAEAQTAEVKKHPSKGCEEPKGRASVPVQLTDNTTVSLRSVRGDLNWDGRDETIVLMRYMGNGKPRPDELLVYEEVKGAERLVARLAVGRTGEYVLSIKALESIFAVENGLLMLQLAVLDARSAEPPSRYIMMYFRLNDGKLNEVERSEPLPLPEHMREKG